MSVSMFQTTNHNEIYPILCGSYIGKQHFPESFGLENKYLSDIFLLLYAHKLNKKLRKKIFLPFHIQFTIIAWRAYIIYDIWLFTASLSYTIIITYNCWDIFFQLFVYVMCKIFLLKIVRYVSRRAFVYWKHKIFLENLFIWYYHTYIIVDWLYIGE